MANIQLVFFLAIVAAGIYFLYDAMKCRLVRRIVAREVSVNDKKDLKIIMWGALILAFSYLLMIAVGRGKMYNGLYHYYIFAFFAMLGSHFLFLMLEKYFEKTKFIKPVFFLFFILLSLLNGYQSFRFNNYRRSREMICSDFFKQVDHFVRRHKNEKDFTFQVLSAEINMWGRYYIGRSPWGVKQKVNVINYLFARYIDSAAPKYYLVHSRNGLYAARSKQEAASYLANLRKKHNRR